MLLSSVSITAYSQESGKVKGAILANQDSTVIPYVHVVLHRDTQKISSATTDLNGNFSLNNINPGDYYLSYSFVGMIKGIDSIELKTGETVELELFMRSQKSEAELVEVVEYKQPVLEQDNHSVGCKISSVDVSKAPTRSVI